MKLRVAIGTAAIVTVLATAGTTVTTLTVADATWWGAASDGLRPAAPVAPPQELSR